MEKKVSIKFTGDNSDLLAKVQASKIGLKELATLGNNAKLPDWEGWTFTPKNLKNDLEAQKAILGSLKNLVLPFSGGTERVPKEQKLPQNLQPFSSFFGKAVFKDLADSLKQSSQLDKFWSDAVKRGTLNGLKQSIKESNQAEKWWSDAVTRGTIFSLRQAQKVQPPPIPQADKTLLEQMSKTFGSGKIGTLFSSLLGVDKTTTSGIFGTLGALRLAFWELQPIVHALKFAFEAVVKSFSAGEKLFIKASQLGRSTGSEFSARFAGNAIGLSDEEVDRFRLQSASAGGGKGALQRFDAVTKLLSPSLAKPFEDAYKFSVKLGEEWQKISGELFTSQKMFDRVSAQLNLFWAEIAAQISPALREFAKNLAELPWADMGQAVGALLSPLKVIIDMFSQLTSSLNALGAFKPAPGTTLWWMMQGSKALDFGREKPYDQTKLNPIGQIALPQMGHWERLGLTFGAGMSNDAAQQTAANTAKSATLLQQIANYFSSGGNLASPANMP